MNIIRQEEERYYVVTQSNKVFYYTDCHFDVTSSIRLTYGFRDFNEAICALDYCVNHFGSGRIITGRLMLDQISEVNDIAIKTKMRDNALNKLTPAEQEVLGLTTKKT